MKWEWGRSAAQKAAQKGSSRRSLSPSKQGLNTTHAEAPFATAGAILIPQWTNHFVRGVRDREGRRERGSWWHRQTQPHLNHGGGLDTGRGLSRRAIKIKLESEQQLN